MDAQTIERYKAGWSPSGPREGFPELPVLPGGRYVDRQFLAFEHEYLWKNS